MAAKASVALDPVADLKRRLARRPAQQLRSCVRKWWRDHRLGEHPAAVGKRVALALLEQKMAAAKLAGIFMLHELLADHLRAADLPAFVGLFEREQLADAIVVDGFAVRVLGTLLHNVRTRDEVVRALVQWRDAPSSWQRRAACLAFTALARQGDHTQSIIALCSAVVWSVERRDQTAVAVLLRELSRSEPTRVEAFVRRHARFMSRDCLRGSIERLPAERQQNLVAHWRRATRF